MKNEQYPPNRWHALFFLLLANFLNILDVTIVNVAIPRIYHDMEISHSQAQWISIIYLISFAACLLPFGKLGDMYGKVRLFKMGLIAFVVTSLICAMSPNIEILMFSRFFQGLASAMMVPQVLAIAVSMFPVDEKTKMFGYVGIVGSLASILGPIVGGALISLNLLSLDWRIIFAINIPIGAIAYWGAKKNLDSEVETQKQRIDWIGNSLIVFISLSLIVPLIEGYSLGWQPWLLIMLAMSLPSIWGLNRWLKKPTADSRQAKLISTNLYKNRLFINQAFFTMLLGATTPGLFFVLAYYIQGVLGFSPFESGVVTLAFPLGVLISSSVLKNSPLSWQRYRVLSGCFSLTIAWSMLYFTVSHVSEFNELYWLSFPLFIGGLGMGSAIIALFQSIMSNVDREDSGAASGAMQALQHVGMAIGIGIAGQIYFISLDLYEVPLLAMKNCVLYSAIMLAGFSLKSLCDLIRVDNQCH
ncbi:MFS transporter [Vibrio ruber]|nr:MFS transporter [Vibrio ruber]WNJ97656.1 MFS transporter [Vibrio ruber]